MKFSFPALVTAVPAAGGASAASFPVYFFRCIFVFGFIFVHACSVGGLSLAPVHAAEKTERTERTEKTERTKKTEKTKKTQKSEIRAKRPARSIEEAVALGRQTLERDLRKLLESPSAEYPMGNLAISATALLKAGMPSKDPLILDVFRKIEGMPILKTYCAACHLFALDALVERRRAEALESPAAGPPPPRRAEGAERARMEELARWIEAAQVRGHGSWTYQKPARALRHDYSNTQFAVLGLEIALRHGIPVAPSTLERVATLFAASLVTTGKPAVVELGPARSLEERLSKTAVSDLPKRAVAAGGWGYTDARRGGDRKEPYASMTAAGASSILVALGRLGAPDANRAKAKVWATGNGPAEKALWAACAWIAEHFDEFIVAPKQLYYTLYSLEKVGDLGGIETFGGHDWYREGADVLLSKQRKDGSWGGHVSTSLAILFLSRATRGFESASAPIVYTQGSSAGRAKDAGAAKAEGAAEDAGGAKAEGGAKAPGSNKAAGGNEDPGGVDGGGPKASGGSADLVWSDRLEGFISARTALRHLAETRSQVLIPLGEEVVRNYPPASREDLVPLLLALLTRADATAAFAERGLAEITGLVRPKRAEGETWLRELAEVRKLEAREDAPVEEVSSLLESTKSWVLKRRIVTLAARRKLRSLGERIAQEFANPPAEYRLAVHGALRLLFGDVVTGPADDSEKAWMETRDRWAKWWAEHGRSAMMEERPPTVPDAGSTPTGDSRSP